MPEVPPGEQVPLAGRITAAEEASERLPTSPTTTPPRPSSHIPGPHTKNARVSKPR